MTKKNLTPEDEPRLGLAISQIIEKFVGERVPYILILPSADRNSTYLISELDPVSLKHNLGVAMNMVDSPDIARLSHVDEKTGEVEVIATATVRRDPKKIN